MNRAEVSAVLARNPFAVTKAIVLLWSYQTPQERSSRRTTELNGKGFSVRHNKNQADIAYWVRWALRLSPSVSQEAMAAAVARYLQGDPRDYRCLSGAYLDRAREVSAYYWRQLAAAARAKAERVPF